MNYDKLKSVQVAHIEVHALPGAVVRIAIHEAMRIAVCEWQNVILIHNDKKYHIYVNDLFGAVLEASDRQNNDEVE